MIIMENIIKRFNNIEIDYYKKLEKNYLYNNEILIKNDKISFELLINYFDDVKEINKYYLNEMSFNPYHYNNINSCDNIYISKIEQVGNFLKLINTNIDSIYKLKIDTDYVDLYESKMFDIFQLINITYKNLLDIIKK